MAGPVESSVVRVRCAQMVAGGAALGRDGDGRVVFVAGAAPGEVVDVRITSARRDSAHGVAVEVIEPSPDRVSPPCPQVALGCGGCDWQHLSVDAQRRYRRGIVHESLRRIGRLDANDVDRALAVFHPTTAPLPASAVRTTVRLALDENGRPGFRAARSHRVVPTQQCLVAHPSIEELLPAIHLPGADEVTIRVGVASGDTAMWWTPPEVELVSTPPGVGVGADAVIHEVIAGVSLRVGSGSFFQPSPQAAEAIVAAVRRATSEPLATLSVDDMVVDAYAGVGLLAATVLPADRPAIAVEGSRDACADAEVNLAGRATRVLRCSVERWRAEPAALVIADPSRAGLGADACRALLAAQPQDVVLVSCDPASLGRDAALLIAAGFDLLSCEVLDAFPHTHHVETVSRFARR
jgi:23S rRNA (uracil1939-C5)-methyltransferase